jgi:hypothetical protein
MNEVVLIIVVSIIHISLVLYSFIQCKKLKREINKVESIPWYESLITGTRGYMTYQYDVYNIDKHFKKPAHTQTTTNGVVHA